MPKKPTKKIEHIVETEPVIIHGYKTFDIKLQCKDLQYEIGIPTRFEGQIKLCESGLHFCLVANDCFEYYPFNPKETRFCEVEAYEVSDQHEQDSKRVCHQITPTRELNWNEVLQATNLGSGNTGRGNSGHWNSGHQDSGHWNKCDYETGMFNSVQSEFIRVFNQPCERQKWEDAQKPSFIYFDLNIWIWFSDMTDAEKKKHPNAEIRDGYLKQLSYQEAWAESFKKATPRDIELLKALPNFDAKVFEEISGIHIE